MKPTRFSDFCYITCLIIVANTVKAALCDTGCEQLDQPFVENAIINGSNKQEGAIWNFKCQQGFWLVGSANITCSNGMWTAAGSCELFCTARPAIDNGVVQYPNHTNWIPRPGTYLEYICNPGFRGSRRSKVIVCDHSEWVVVGECIPGVEPAVPPTWTRRGPGNLTFDEMLSIGRFFFKNSTRFLCIRGIAPAPGRFTMKNAAMCMPLDRPIPKARQTLMNFELEGNFENQTIVHPAGGGNYSNFEDKCWNMRVDVNYAIEFTVDYADIATGDGFSVYDTTSSSKLPATIVASHIAGPAGLKFQVPGHKAAVCFKSNELDTGKGFKLTYKAVAFKRPSRSFVDCESLKYLGLESGVHNIYPRGRNGGPVSVKCEMDRYGGGWTVIQQRNGSLQFNKTWSDYKTGFGSMAEGDFWLGNRNIHKITTSIQPAVSYMLLIVLEKSDGSTGLVHLENFHMDGKKDDYRVHFVERPICNTTNVADFAAFNNHQPFSTKDRNNNGDSSKNCGLEAGGGWWYSGTECTLVNLNARRASHAKWPGFVNDGEVITKTEIMIRRTKLENGICQ